MVTVTLQPFSGLYATARLQPADAIPIWADGPGFMSISRTDEELSIVCLADRVPETAKADRDWRVIKFVGPFAFEETGIAAAVLAPLATAEIGVFLVSTYDTDYLMVKQHNFDRTIETLRIAGHRIL